MSYQDAEDYGYQRGRCPDCGRTIWSDTSGFDCPCGWTNVEEEEEDEPNL